MQVHKGGGVEHEEEDIEVLELPFEKAIKMVADGNIKDAKTIMLLQYALINKLITN
jgi:GDP-mannose pyrophosphatase NudK